MSEQLKKSILIVDDDKAVLLMLKDRLEDSGYTVATARNGMDALTKLLGDPTSCHAIVSDLIMPGMGGIELLKEIQSRPELSIIPFIVMTASSSPDEICDGIRLGAHYYIQKPVNFRILESSLESAFSRYKTKLYSKLSDEINTSRLQGLQAAMNEHAIVSIANIRGEIIYANQLFTDISGYSLDELIGQSHRIVKSDRHDDAFFQNMWKTIAAGNVWHGEIENRTKGGKPYWVKSTILPIRNQRGKVEQYISIRTDISSQKIMEVERVQMLEKLLETGRRDSLGTLAGGVAHEINTPIQYIGDNLTFIKSWVPRLLEIVENARSSEGIEEWGALRDQALSMKYDFVARELPVAIDQSIDGVGKIAEIVQSIKEFSFPTTKAPHLFDVNRAIKLSAAVSRNEWKHVAHLNLSLDPALPKFNGIEGEVNQVMLNMIINASHAIEMKKTDAFGKIDIETNNLGNKIQIKISDNGIGIPEGNISRLFDLFFTTKGPGKGTGQGLAIAHAIILRHGGEITVDSQVGVGTHFHILLPVDES